eukprot:2951931-Amphidinium_carterae.3
MCEALRTGAGRPCLLIIEAQCGEGFAWEATMYAVHPTLLGEQHVLLKNGPNRSPLFLALSTDKTCASKLLNGITKP